MLLKVKACSIIETNDYTLSLKGIQRKSYLLKLISQLNCQMKSVMFERTKKGKKKTTTHTKLQNPNPKPKSTSILITQSKHSKHVSEVGCIYIKYDVASLEHTKQ